MSAMVRAVLVAAALSLAAHAAELTKYYVAFLHKGPAFAAEPAGSPARQQLHKDHVAYIERMTGEGKLVAYGPFQDAGDLRGMYVFKAASLEEARAWAESEPSVKTGMIAVRVVAWMGRLDAAKSRE